MNRIPLEPAAEAVSIQSSVPPLIFQLPPEEGRRVLETAQDEPVRMCPASIACIQADDGCGVQIPVYLVTPRHCCTIKNVIYYIHGAGWVFGSFHTHEKLVRELAARTNSLVVFPEYTRAPEARYPVAIEQCYHIMCSLPELLCRRFPDIDFDTLTVSGDSAGGAMAIAMALMTKERCGPNIQKLLLYYPVTNACFDTPSYCQFACGYYLYREGMKWFWQQYAPIDKCRRDITASPLRATVDELRGLPQTMIINGEADVLRDEGEAFAKKLRTAGVDVTAVRIQGIIHDFVMLNSLDQTDACRAAMDLSTGWINRKNGCSVCC